MEDEIGDDAENDKDGEEILKNAIYNLSIEERYDEAFEI